MTRLILCSVFLMLARAALSEEHDGTNIPINEDTPGVAACVQAWEKSARDNGHAPKPHQFVVEACECNIRSMVSYVNAHGRRPLFGGAPRLKESEILAADPPLMRACVDGLLPKYPGVLELQGYEKTIEDPPVAPAVADFVRGFIAAAPLPEPRRDEGGQKATPESAVARWQAAEARVQAADRAVRASGRFHRLTFKGTTNGFNHGFLAVRSFDDCAVHYVGAPVNDPDDQIGGMLADFGGACSGDDCGTRNSLNVRVVVDVETLPSGETLEYAVTVSPIARKGSADAACLKDLGERTVEGVITDFSAGNSSGEFSVRLRNGRTMDFDFSWGGPLTVNGSRSWAQDANNPWVLGQTPVTVVYKTIAERTGKLSVEPLSITTH